MSADRTNLLLQLFEQACGLAPAARRSFLDKHCAGDADLRRDLEQMLAHDADSKAAFQSKAIGGEMGQLALRLADSGAAPAGAADEEMPTEIGPYRVIGRLGQGGMGTVYEAEQQSPRRVVALKVIRPEFVSTNLAQRFQLEAHVLGRLQHPGIAQIFEAGVANTPRGPKMYIAMELVRGKTLIDHANDPAAPFNTRQRVALMARVCDAVHHAHQRGVIHRDLKPTNILVVSEASDSAAAQAAGSGAASTARGGASRGPDSRFGALDSSFALVGQPKILDFGVARATDADMQITTIQTGIGQLIGTVPYMSPEQLSGDPAEIDNRSDVYALGVVLYQLLCGRLPYATASRSLPEAIRTIREDTPPPLSSLNRTLRGELEIITAKALDKDKSRRYQSAAELGADLRRFLSGEPILARRDSSWYVLQKTLRRYRLAVISASVVVVLAVASSIALAFLYGQARDNARLAQQERETARVARDDALREADRAQTEERKTHEVNRVLMRIFQAADPRSAKGEDPTVREVLNDYGDSIVDSLKEEPDVRAAVEHTLGQTYFELGDYERAYKHHRAAYEAAKAFYGNEPRREPADYAVSLAATLGTIGRLDDAEQLLREALASHRKLRGDGSAAVAWDLSALGMILLKKGDADGAEPLMRQSIEIYRRSPHDPEDAAESEQSPYVDALSSLVAVLHQKNAYEEAEPLAREAVEVARKELGDSHPQLATALNNLGAILAARGNVDAAIPFYEEAIAVQRRAGGNDHPDVAAGLANLGLVYLDRGQPERAEPLYREAVEIRRAKFPAGHIGIAEALSGWGGSLARIGRAAEAEPVLREALDIRRTQLKPGDARIGFTLGHLGVCLTALQRYEEAENVLRESYDIIRTRRGDRHPHTLEALRNLLKLYEAAGKTADAERCRKELEGPADQ